MFHFKRKKTVRKEVPLDKNQLFKRQIKEILELYFEVADKYSISFSQLNDIFSYLKGIQVDCPEKKALILIQDTLKDVSPKLMKISELFKELNDGLIT